jgi:hypothetical protein
MNTMRMILAALIALVLLRGTARADEGLATINGAYPLWEYTGELYGRGHAQVGYQHAQLGLGRVQIGTQPFLDMNGIVNGEVKLAVSSGERTHTALVVGWYDAPTDVDSHAMGNVAPAGAPLYAPLTLVPASIASTAILGARLRVHASATLLTQWSDDSRERALSAGTSTLLEYRAFAHWAAMMHLGVEGLGLAEQAHAGLSVAYRLPYIDLRAGWARRFESTGAQGDAVLVDGALVF